jgi:hypothetical protein
MSGTVVIEESQHLMVTGRDSHPLQETLESLCVHHASVGGYHLETSLEVDILVQMRILLQRP